MTTTRFNLEVSHSQIAVFRSSLKQPFNDWTQRHVDQGFAWRPGSVSFRTLSESGPHEVEIGLTDQGVADAAARVIEVPFEVPADGAVEVATISDSTPLILPAGRYCLRCELFDPDQHGSDLVRLTFFKHAAPEFTVVRADRSLLSRGELLKTAEPA